MEKSPQVRDFVQCKQYSHLHIVHEQVIAQGMSKTVYGGTAVFLQNYTLQPVAA